MNGNNELKIVSATLTKHVSLTRRKVRLTCCSLYYVCSISQAHEIKLVEAPGLLVRRLHRVLPPLVNHLISWVSICNYTEHVCVCVTLGAAWHILMMDTLCTRTEGHPEQHLSCAGGWLMKRQSGMKTEAEGR